MARMPGVREAVGTCSTVRAEKGGLRAGERMGRKATPLKVGPTQALNRAFGRSFLQAVPFGIKNTSKVGFCPLHISVV